MIDYCIRHRYSLPAGKSGPEAEVCILAIGKEVLIKKTHFVQHTLSVHGCTCAGDKYLLKAIVLLYIQFIPSPPLRNAAAGNQQATDRIDNCMVMLGQYLTRP